MGLSRSRVVGVFACVRRSLPSWNGGTVVRPQWAEQPIEKPARLTDPEALWTSPNTIGLPPMTGPPSSSTVRYWRLDQFISLGFDTLRAAALADAAVDLAQARRLVALGCPPETASRILI